MQPNFADFEQSIRRAPARARVLLMMASLSISYPTALAKAASVDHTQLMGILYGAPPKYSEKRALVVLRLVAEIWGPNGRAFEITERGRRKARQIAARGVRQEVRRRAVKRIYEGPVLVERSSQPPPADTSTFQWTFHPSP